MKLTKDEEREFDRLIRKLGWVPMNLWFGGERYIKGELYDLVCSQIPHALEEYIDRVDLLVVGYQADDDTWLAIREAEEEEADQVNFEEDDDE